MRNAEQNVAYWHSWEVYWVGSQTGTMERFLTQLQILKYMKSY